MTHIETVIEELRIAQIPMSDSLGKALDGLADERERARRRIEYLRGSLKAAAGLFADLDRPQDAQKCIDWAGDMEPNASNQGQP